MKISISCILGVFSLILTAQTRFKEGYFISVSDVRTSCLIKEVGRESNPDKIVWKSSSKAKPQKLTIDQLQEFSIQEGRKFRKYTVDLNLAPTAYYNLDDTRDPRHEQRTVLLEVLIESNVASLFMYKEGDIVNFFYTKDNSPELKPLIYKEYLTRSGNIGKNEEYKHTLQTQLACSNSDVLRKAYLTYTRVDLLHYFKRYIECKQGTTEYSYHKKKSKVDLTVLVGANQSSQTYLFAPVNLNSPERSEASSIHFGASFEIYPNFLNNKLSFGIESMIHRVNEDDALINYFQFTNNIFLRYYFYLNPKGKVPARIYLDSGLSWNYNDRKDGITRAGSFKTGQQLDIPIGLGVALGRFRIQARTFVFNEPQIRVLEAISSHNSNQTLFSSNVLNVKTVFLSVGFDLF